ncbi:hypothetical protein [Streptomyces sp. NPDC101455]|uniref:hypothetical protein n=1 Tax=Streptomyces sp. NPDC101455 TaxID=3366142 RepID=UPI003803D98E
MNDRIVTIDNSTPAATGVGAPLHGWIEPRPTTATSQVTQDLGAERLRAKYEHEDKLKVHRDHLFNEWQSRAAELGKSAPAVLLGRLSDLGFAWRDVARMLGVSVAALQKWRRGEKMTGTNRLRLASLLAACDLIVSHYAVDEIASWFEMPLTTECPITPIDLYADEQPKLLFDYASGHGHPEQVLSEFVPDWRERYRSDFEVYEAMDGELAIRPKDK